MFGLKLNDGPKKARRHHGLAFWIAGAFALAIEGLLGMNVAFMVDQSVYIVLRNMFAGTPLELLAIMGALLASAIVGVCFTLGGMWTFAGFMDNFEDARAFYQHYACRWVWPQLLIVVSLITIFVLDYYTLAFRANYFTAKGGDDLYKFFLVLIPFPFIIGLIMYIIENTPRDRRVVKAERNVEQLHADSIQQALESMPDHLRTRYLDEHDHSALMEHQQNIAQEREAARQQELDAMAERDERKRERKEAHRQLHTPSAKRQGPFPLASRRQDAS